MITQTLLSAAAPASQGHLRLARGIKWHRHSCLCAVAKPGTQPIEAAASLPVNVLIANADASSIGTLSYQLESKGLSYRSPLRHQRPQLLIANLELEFHLTHTKLSPLRISNRKFSPILRLQFSSRPRSKSANESSASYQRSLCILIRGSAIKTRRNLCIDNNLEISNRR